jgi:hypothetical protein
MDQKRQINRQETTKLRQTEVSMVKGQTMEEVVCQLSTSDATYYKWRNIRMSCLSSGV